MPAFEITAARVQGGQAEGATFNQYPVAVAGKDQNGQVRALQITANGLKVDAAVSIPNPLPVSQSGTWNVTVNTALPAGANVIGAVTQSGTWTVAQGTQGAGGAASWQVQGAGATGAAVAGNPVLFGGKDTAGNVEPIRLGVDGNIQPSTVSTNNSSTATLTANSIFTGTGEDVTSFRSIVVTVASDQASASGGVSLQFSQDNSNWDTKVLFQYVNAAGAGVPFTVNVIGKFFRVVYTNGGTNQGSFRLQTIYSPVAVAPVLSTGTLASSNNFQNQVVPVGVFDSGNTVRSLTTDAGSDARSSALQQLHVMAHQYAFSGSTDDRCRLNVDVTDLASAARTTTQNIDITTYNGRALIVTLDLTAYSGTGGLTVSINHKDPASGKFVQLHANFAQIVATGTYTYIIGSNAVAAGGVTGVGANPIGRTVRITVTVGDASSQTYSLGHCVVCQ